MNNNDLSTHWRDSAYFPKFYMLDARVCFPFIAFFFYMRISTVIICLLSVLFLAILNKFNLNIKSFLIVLREIIGGRKKL